MKPSSREQLTNTFYYRSKLNRDFKQNEVDYIVFRIKKQSKLNKLFIPKEIRLHGAK